MLIGCVNQNAAAIPYNVDHDAVYPPSTAKSAPVMCADWLQQRKTTASAISSGSAMRCREGLFGSAPPRTFHGRIESSARRFRRDIEGKHRAAGFSPPTIHLPFREQTPL